MNTSVIVKEKKVNFVVPVTFIVKTQLITIFVNFPLFARYFHSVTNKCYTRRQKTHSIVSVGGGWQDSGDSIRVIVGKKNQLKINFVTVVLFAIINIIITIMSSSFSSTYSSSSLSQGTQRKFISFIVTYITK